MKFFHRILPAFVLLTFALSLSAAFAADETAHPVTPPQKAAKKWRAGYLEGGPYKDYQAVFTETLKALAELGWVKIPALPPMKKNPDTGELWAWLAENAQSGHMEFVKDAWYSANWDDKRREEIKKELIDRLNQKGDIDLMFAFGTWAGTDLANNAHSVPTVVCSTSAPIQAKIIKSAEDSGYDHIHAVVDPTQYARQIRAFHDVIGFKRLGISFEDTLTGRSYIGMAGIENVAKERGFEIVSCHLEKEHNAPVGESEAEQLECARKLAPQIDAYCLAHGYGVTARSVPDIMAVLKARKIPSFAQPGPEFVRKGVLMGIASLDYSGVGKFHAEAVARIFNGAKARDLSMIYEEPVKFVFNAATALEIGLDPDAFDFLSSTADVVYEKIEK